VLLREFDECLGVTASLAASLGIRASQPRSSTAWPRSCARGPTRWQPIAPRSRRPRDCAPIRPCGWCLGPTRPRSPRRERRAGLAADLLAAAR